MQICSETHTSRDGPEFAEGVLLQLLLLLSRCDFASLQQFCFLTSVSVQCVKVSKVPRQKLRGQRQANTPPPPEGTNKAAVFRIL